MDDAQRAGRNVGRDELGLDERRELTAHRALEVAPDLERHRRVRLAKGSAIGQRGRNLELGPQKRRAVGGHPATLEQHGSAERHHAEFHR